MSRGKAGAALSLLTLALLGVAPAKAAPPATSPQPPPGFFGVGPQTWVGPWDLERMAQGGVGTLRLEFPWAIVDPQEPAGGFDWTAFDPVVGTAAARGIRILPVLYQTPEWVAALDGHPGCGTDCRDYLPTGDLAVHAWEQFASAAAERYGKGGTFWGTIPEIEPRPIRAWQVWNEQNSGHLTQPQPAVRPYARIVRTTSRAVKAHDPGARVILGGMIKAMRDPNLGGLPGRGFLTRLYHQRGIARHFEGIGIQPYSHNFPAVARQVRALRSVAARAGDPDVETWITEIGWSSAGTPHPLNMGEDGQAKFLTRAFRLFIHNRERWNVQLVSWFSWRDRHGPAICEWCPWSGLFYGAGGGLLDPLSELRPKPAWQAYLGFSGGT